MDKLEYDIRWMTVCTDDETGEEYGAWAAIDKYGYIADVYDTWAQAVQHTIREFHS